MTGTVAGFNPDFTAVNVSDFECRVCIEECIEFAATLVEKELTILMAEEEAFGSDVLEGDPSGVCNSLLKLEYASAFRGKFQGATFSGGEA
jgi:hypothetical protein